MEYFVIVDTESERGYSLKHIFYERVDSFGSGVTLSTRLKRCLSTTYGLRRLVQRSSDLRGSDDKLLSMAFRMKRNLKTKVIHTVSKLPNAKKKTQTSIQAGSINIMWWHTSKGIVAAGTFTSFSTVDSKAGSRSVTSSLMLANTEKLALSAASAQFMTAVTPGNKTCCELFWTGVPERK